ncbi:MAG TPA: MFS transporter, partial [Hyphomicrobiaceae bacterium]|nr:MFS transporter [Hyphomicrobiaceae bacterium]
MRLAEMTGKGRGLAVRLALFYAAIFASLGIYMPFLPVWLAWQGMTPAEIGFLTAAPMFLRVIATPAIAFFADRRGDLKETILLASWVGLGAAAVLGGVKGFWPILIMILVFQIAQQTILPLTEAKALQGIRANGLDYGRIRLWGSVSFIVANLVGGMVIAHYSGGAVIVMVVMSFTMVVLAAHGLPPRDTGAARAVSRNDPATHDHPPPKPRMRLRDLRALATAPWFLVLIAASGAIQSSHAVYYAFSAIHWRAQGITDGWIGGLWAIGVAAEVALFAISGTLMRRFGAIGLVIIGGAAGVLRWTVMAFDPSFPIVVIMQLLHALTFGATFLGTLHILQNSVPDAQAGSAQALHAALSPGIIMGVVTVTAGQIYLPLQAASFFVMAALSMIGIVFTVVLDE